MLPMAVADFVGEAFDTDPVRAAIATRGVQYTAMGPWSAGTTSVLLSEAAGNDGGAAGQTVFAQGGPGALADALVVAARNAGAEIRTTAPVDDAVRFVEAFLLSPATTVSGRFLHARDTWAEAVAGAAKLPADHWKLRRVE